MQKPRETRPRFLLNETIFQPAAISYVSQQGEFKNTIKNFLWEVHVKNFWPKKLRREKQILSYFPIDFFLSRFLAVSQHEEPKSTIKLFSKISPENLKKTSI
jgi:hypothetical protein